VDNDFAFSIGFIVKKQSLIPRVIYDTVKCIFS